MEFIREYFDPADGKYVLEFETTEAEKKKLDEYCKQNNYNMMTNREFYRRLEEKYPSKTDNHQKAFNIRVVRYED